MLKIKRFLFSFCFLLSSLTTYSQDYTINRVPCENVEYLISCHYVKNFNYPPCQSYSVPAFFTFIDSLNLLFRPACIQFKICKIDTILDYNYFLVQNEDRTREYENFVATYYDDHAINIYWVGDYQYETPFGICDSLPNRPHIFLSLSDPNFNNRNFFNRQMLNYFGMPTTESKPWSLEFVNKTNGQVTADSIWDTPADPYGLIVFNDTFIPPPGFMYLYTTKKDPNGDYYNPMVYNLMCDIATPIKYPQLTNGQYQRLVTNERMCRKKRWFR